jgi:hypothetical protein
MGSKMFALLLRQYTASWTILRPGLACIRLAHSFGIFCFSCCHLWRASDAYGGWISLDDVSLYHRYLRLPRCWLRAAAPRAFYAVVIG